MPCKPLGFDCHELSVSLRFVRCVLHVFPFGPVSADVVHHLYSCLGLSVAGQDMPPTSARRHSGVMTSRNSSEGLWCGEKRK